MSPETKLALLETTRAIVREFHQLQAMVMSLHDRPVTHVNGAANRILLLISRHVAEEDLPESAAEVVRWVAWAILLESQTTAEQIEERHRGEFAAYQASAVAYGNAIHAVLTKMAAFTTDTGAEIQRAKDEFLGRGGLAALSAAPR
jgi:hypothetical protein